MSKKKQIKEEKLLYATKRLKTKAFLTDSFMLLMPIFYITFYFIMQGREDFASHRLYGWGFIFIIYFFVETIFIAKSGQTPGYRAYGLKVIDNYTRKTPSFAIILFRNFSFILSILTFGWVLIFFRKDYKSLHDILSATCVIYSKTDETK